MTIEMKNRRHTRRGDFVRSRRQYIATPPLIGLVPFATARADCPPATIAKAGRLAATAVGVWPLAAGRLSTPGTNACSDCLLQMRVGGARCAGAGAGAGAGVLVLVLGCAGRALAFLVVFELVAVLLPLGVVLIVRAVVVSQMRVQCFLQNRQPGCDYA